MSAYTDINSNCHDTSNDNDNNNGFNGNEDKQRCAEYHKELVHEFVVCLFATFLFLCSLPKIHIIVVFNL